MLVFGTRPEAIKMCPLVKEFQKHPTEFETILCITGQHREMLDLVLKIFDVKPDIDLNIIKRLYLKQLLERAHMKASCFLHILPLDKNDFK